MVKSTELPALHIPTKPPILSQGSGSSDLSLAQRRQVRSSEKATNSSISTYGGPDTDGEHYVVTPQAAVPTPRPRPPITQSYLMNKPLPLLPPEAFEEGYRQLTAVGVPTASAAASEPELPRERTPNQKNGFLKKVVKVVTLRRKSSGTKIKSNPRPPNYVDKGTQTEPDLWQPVKPSNVRSVEPTKNNGHALRDYHASVKAGHDPVKPRRSIRPAMMNMKSMISFLDTSPSQPRTPTPLPQPTPTLATPRSTVSPMSDPGKRVHYLQNELKGQQNIESQQLVSGVPLYGQPRTNASAQTVGTYESLYSTYPTAPADPSNFLGGASSSPIQVKASTTPSSPVTTPARKQHEAESILRPPNRRGMSDLPAPPALKQEIVANPAPSSLRPPTPMPVEPPSATPHAISRGPARMPYNMFFKGRQAELRRSSPSPLRQQASVNDLAPSPPETPSTGSQHSDSSVQKSGLHDSSRLSPSFYDHHLRAARQGLPPDAFIPPPTPPAEEVIFRRPIYDYFSTPEGQAVKQKQESMPHVPDHYENSPLCPLNPKHRGGQGDYCPIHGSLKTAEGSADGGVDNEDDDLRLSTLVQPSTSFRDGQSTRSASSSVRSVKSRDFGGASDGADLSQGDMERRDDELRANEAAFLLPSPPSPPPPQKRPQQSATVRSIQLTRKPAQKEPRTTARISNDLQQPTPKQTTSTSPIIIQSPQSPLSSNQSTPDNTPPSARTPTAPHVDGVESWGTRRKNLPMPFHQETLPHDAQEEPWAWSFKDAEAKVWSVENEETAAWILGNEKDTAAACSTRGLKRMASGLKHSTGGGGLKNEPSPFWFARQETCKSERRGRTPWRSWEWVPERDGKGVL